MASTDWKEKYPHLLKMTRYDVTNKIGEGGMAAVFKAHDKELDDVVALKILKSDLVSSDDMIGRFKQEIKIARKISHRNICRIYDFGSMESLFYIVMEYLEGIPLSKVIRVEDAIPEKNKIPLSIRMLQGLAAAHEEDIIHMDLKPPNIMVIKNLEPVIMDFGLARRFEPDPDSTQKALFGTPAYMSPEQVVGKNLDHRSDLYAFGVIFYELMTRNYPFKETNLFKLLYSHVNDKPIPPRKFNPALDPRIEEIILKCLEKSPEKRYSSATQIVADLMEAAGKNKFPPIKKKKSTSKKTKINTVKTARLKENIQAPPQPALKRVLIADDDLFIRKTLSKMFKTMSLNVITAENGQEAVSIAFSEKPDLICLDMMMPVMQGLEAAEILLSNDMTKDIPIVIISAKQDTEYMLYSRELGIKDYITKPVHLKDLQQRIGYWLS